ncbi:MAG: repeat-containing protein [Xanthobacteraceae bacterium]|jgi:tetratricopeptide (TPR) repeat protein|nr:repeat-containing protein [Xanthobacteraceae bacterium]
MRALFAALIIAAAPLGGFAPPALAQSAAPAAPGEKSLPGEKPPTLPDLGKPDGAAKTDVPSEKSKEAAQEPDRGKRLDALFAALKAAPDKDSAKNIAERIDVALTPSGSDTADLLMSRAALATQAKDYDLAIELLDGVLKVEPNHLEAWNKRATVFYLKQDFSDALNDLRQVVAREPRHYGAWSGIAIICKEIGDEKHALEAARQALAIYPHLDEVEDMEKTLTISVEGRPI